MKFCSDLCRSWGDTRVWTARSLITWKSARVSSDSPLKKQRRATIDPGPDPNLGINTFQTNPGFWGVYPPNLQQHTVLHNNPEWAYLSCSRTQAERITALPSGASQAASKERKNSTATHAIVSREWDYGCIPLGVSGSRFLTSDHSDYGAPVGATKRSMSTDSAECKLKTKLTNSWLLHVVRLEELGDEYC